MTEHSIVHSFNTYYDLHLPAGSETPLPLLIATHGYGGTKESMMRLAKRVNSKDFVIASLQGPYPHFKRLGDPDNPKQSIGFGWLTPWKADESRVLHHDSIDQIISVLASEGKVDSANVFLLGFSQSVAINLRYALRCPGKIRGHVAICGGIPFDLEDNPAYQHGHLDALYLHTSNDEFYPPDRVEENMQRLRPLARDLTVQTYAGGHMVTAPMFAAINSWLQEKLRCEASPDGS